MKAAYTHSRPCKQRPALPIRGSFLPFVVTEIPSFYLAQGSPKNRLLRLAKLIGSGGNAVGVAGVVVADAPRRRNVDEVIAVADVRRAQPPNGSRSQDIPEIYYAKSLCRLLSAFFTAAISRASSAIKPTHFSNALPSMGKRPLAMSILERRFCRAALAAVR